MAAGGRHVEGIVREVGRGMYTVLCFRWVTNKAPHTTRDILLRLCGPLGGRGDLGEDRHVCVYG